MKDYIQAEGMLLILTLISIIISPYPYICMIVASLLMIIFTMKSLYEEEMAVLEVFQFLLSFVFSVIGGHFLNFLIFSQCRGRKIKWLSLCMPAAFYGMVEGFWFHKTTPLVIFYMLLLLIMTSILWGIEAMLQEYITTKQQVHHAVEVTAVGELHEKKLNQELVMKHYLADRNARFEERENISRNIHNSVGHSITAAIMTLEAADMLMDADPQKARSKMNVANERIKESLASIRRAVRVLDEENTYCTLEDFLQQMTEVADNFSMDANVKIRTDFGNRLMDKEEQTCILSEHAEFLTGALMELLTNGVKHGHADMFIVGVTTDSRHIRLYVEDNGNSDFNEDNQSLRIEQGFGLKKIISYVEKWAGNVSFSNQKGFRGEITLPVYQRKE